MLKRFVLCALLGLAVSPATAEMRVPQSQIEIQIGFAPLVKQAAPAVVNIYAKRIVAQRVNPFINDPFFGNLFGDLGKVQPRVQNSLGSGVILSDDGIVVSNYHVVGQATDIRVVLNDRREFSATVMLADQEADLAILQLNDASDMPYLSLRNSKTVEVGELVLAIGNPFGVGQTVTSGIVSGLARSGAAAGRGRGYFIQTDAAINPGNSGGALIDVNGALIGVNTSILTRSGGSNGIGFAIPSALVAAFVDQARDGNTRFEKPWAGMSGQPVDADIAEGLGLGAPGGIVISDLHRVSPFLEAGFQPGDVILAVDGQPVNTASEMVFRMAVAGLGSESQIRRFREGEVSDIVVRLIKAPEIPARQTRETARKSIVPGLVISNINPAVLAQYGLPLSTMGVVIGHPGDVASRMGLRVGDVLQKINRTEVVTVQDVLSALQQRSGSLVLHIQRGDQRHVMRFRL